MNKWYETIFPKEEIDIINKQIEEQLKQMMMYGEGIYKMKPFNGFLHENPPLTEGWEEVIENGSKSIRYVGLNTKCRHEFVPIMGISSILGYNCSKCDVKKEDCE